MKLTTIFGVSTLVVGALAAYPPQNLSAVDNTVDTTHHKHDRIYVRPAMAKECLNANFGHRQTVKHNKCHTYDDGFHTLKARVVLGKDSHILTQSCALVAFTDMACQDDGLIVQMLRRNEDTCHEVDEDDMYHSVRWVCDSAIEQKWLDDYDNSASIITRDVSNTMDKGVKGRVKVWPADNEDCNSPNKRKPESFNHDHCQHFKNGFRSIRATADFHKQEHTHRCALLAYTDHKCKVNPAYVVDLYDTAALEVCQAVSLKQDGSHLMAGHSVKWICDDLLDEFINSTPQTKVEDTTSTVTAESANPTVTTVTVGCTLTSDVRFSTTASSHVTTETSVSTHLATHTRVVTHIQSHTIPFSSTYSVCDVEVSTLY
ncbi:hypothetical protein D6D01_09751 [Aureobasidium pullulans]|uniref:Ricin B lectin domain-containing protein n=1 Tax=Aureobasidium pullulans TaxID=5580 RepID=A0A4S9K0D2_AURPU|nr:hypothetical protein D6D01_09751 [Aureobasidium pullulans]